MEAMKLSEYKYVFGPIPSRRMGVSLGISPVLAKSCSYSCVYCQLGRTKHLMDKTADFFETSEIIKEFENYLKENTEFDVVTVVGEGEPTLFSDLGNLIDGLKKLTDKPVAVITNGSLLTDNNVREALKRADIVLPSLDAGDVETFKKINRPHGRLNFEDITNGLVEFTKEYKGQLWMETMIVKGINDSEEQLLSIKKILDKLKFDKLYINTPVRPPAEGYVEEPDDETIEKAVNILKGISISQISSKGFFSEIEDDFEAIKSIIARHPMNKFEVKSFLDSRECKDEEVKEVFAKLSSDKSIDVVEYKNYTTYRTK